MLEAEMNTFVRNLIPNIGETPVYTNINIPQLQGQCLAEIWMKARSIESIQFFYYRSFIWFINAEYRFAHLVPECGHYCLTLFSLTSREVSQIRCRLGNEDNKYRYLSFWFRITRVFIVKRCYTR